MPTLNKHKFVPDFTRDQLEALIKVCRLRITTNSTTYYFLPPEDETVVKVEIGVRQPIVQVKSNLWAISREQYKRVKSYEEAISFLVDKEINK